ncbi:hypothetical protein [Virgibacillus halodenitrificans]|uniref:hypothetical protein n=1 Tax=Virgibacillus halodenitrificans TaxID=1482 RepID=UPI000EF506A0|nr:hypothetical protein [Virgibacillus halodenitrificans]
MKKTILLLLTGLFILSGCSSVQDHVVMKDDGSIVRKIVITIDKTDENYSEDKEKMALEQIQKASKEQGYKYNIEDVISEGKKIVQLSKKIEYIDKNNVSIDLFGDEDVPGFTLSEEEGFFKTRYITDGEVESANQELHIEEDLISYQLNVHFPSKVMGDHNAQHVTEDGKTLSWKEGDNQDIALQYDVSSWNYSNIYLVVCPVLVVLLLIFYFWHKNNRPTGKNRRIPIREKK